MTKHLKKQELRREARRADFRQVRDAEAKGFREPGSMNSHKSRSIKDVQVKRGKRRK